ncbi:MAG TPA: LacI family DNA-binding transcriptional regulator [Cyclobacteriaceae bacterium]|nr:LacI family DNA-binding transcriptional regulator [Cyclobacteriaceae bacterium]
MKREKTTIHDIARKLNITASTVSRALKDHPRISTETKKAVLRVAEKLNYQPNHIAAALRNGRSNIIGIIVPSVDRSFFSSVVRGIEEIANKAKYNVMVCQHYDSYEKEVQNINALLNAQVDGIIVSFSKETDDFSHFMKVKEKGIPLIMFDRGNSELEVSHVVVDDYFGSYKAVEHLIQQGFTRIAHFTNFKKISIYKDRLRGYREALEAHGLPYDPSLIIESNLQLEDGRKSVEHLFKLPTMPDAIFSASALATLGAMQVLKEKGYRVPDDVALVAFTNELFCDYTTPTLSAVDQHSMRMGNAAAEIFLEEITKGHLKFIPQKIVLKPELIIRQSSIKKK